MDVRLQELNAALAQMGRAAVLIGVKDTYTPGALVTVADTERWDGSGYPQGLRGEETPLTARVFAVVDVLDALTHPRPHRPAVPVAAALEHLRRESGILFDPRVVEVARALPPDRWATLLGCGPATATSRLEGARRPPVPGSGAGRIAHNP